MRRLQYSIAVVGIMFFFGFAGFVSAQVTTGIQPLGSYGGGPEAVNLANLNVHWDVPMVSKKGRGLDFGFTLGYDTSVWTPVSFAWVPTVNWGWTAETQTQTGYVTSKTNLWKCFSGTTWYWTTTYTAWAYIDKRGTPHPFSTTPATIGTCPTFASSATATASDGSGYQITAYTGSATIKDVRGHTLYPPYSTGTGAGSAVDDNGNEISYNGTTTFTDTLGISVLTKSGTNPVTYTYNAPSGTKSYTVSYSNYTVKTNFGCTGITEYGPTSNSLPSTITLPDGSSYQFTYESTPGFSGDTTGRLASIKLPTGGTISYSYSGGSNGITCADGSTATLKRTTPDGIWNYAHTESGSAWTTTITDPASDSITLNFRDVFINTSTYFARSEYETQRQVTDVSNGSIQTIATCYNGSTPTTPCDTPSFSIPIQRRTAFPQPSGSKSLESEVDSTYNTFGSPTEVDEYDYGASSTPGSLLRKTKISYASLGNDIQDHPSQVQIYDGAGTLKAQTTYTYDQGTPTTTTGTPQHISISGSRGNLTTLSSLVQGSSSLTKTFTYYDTGNINVATDTNGANTTPTYGGCSNSFPTQIAEPTGLSVYYVWDCNGGVVTKVTDANSQSTQTSYVNDPFWRPVTITDPESNVTTNSYTTTTAESVMNFNSSASTADVLTTVDSLGRKELVQRRQGPSSSTFDTVQYTYDANGRLKSVTQPCATSAGSGCSGATTTTTYDALNRTETVQDGGLGTVTYNYSNNDVLQDIGPAPTGENDKKKQLEYDGIGRLSSVCELTSGTGSGSCAQNTTQTGFYTTYAYDPLGDLTSVTQNAQAASGSRQNRTYAFDDLGRMTSEQNPETGSGAITYTYDTADSTCSSYSSLGDLVEKKDAMGNYTCPNYDSLHRQTLRTYPSGPYGTATPSKCFVYDAATVNSTAMTNAKGRLAEAYTTNSASCTGSGKIVDEGFSYSPRGESSDVWEQTPDSGGWYHVNATYWASGTLDTLNGGTSPLPGLPAITYGGSAGSGLDGEGRITQVAASTGQNPLINSVTYTNTGTTQPIGSLASVVYGSTTTGTGDSDSYNYDVTTGRMTGYTFYMGTTPLSQAAVLTWNKNSTLQQLQITDQINTGNTQTCAFGYDDLARIASANCGTPWSQTFGFDPFGNLSKTGSASFLPTYTGTSGAGSPTNQYYQISGGPTGTSNYYDTNGNLKYDITHSYSWDADGEMLSVDGSTITLIYDALDRMAEQTRGSSHSEIVYGPTGAKLALMNGQSLLWGFVGLPGGGTAVYNNGGLAFYRHADHLGSSRLATTTSRTKYFDVAYAPYGEEYNGSGTTDLSFTDKNQDTVQGGWSNNLYDFPAREYRTGHGRWTRPDPAGLAAVNPGDPQTWNLYSYVRNNPLSGTDPTGLQMCQPCGSIGHRSGGNMLTIYTGSSGMTGMFDVWTEYNDNGIFDETIFLAVNSPWASWFGNALPAGDGFQFWGTVAIIVSSGQVTSGGTTGGGANSGAKETRMHCAIKAAQGGSAAAAMGIENIPLLGDLTGNSISQLADFGENLASGKVGSTAFSLATGGLTQGIPIGKGLASEGIYGVLQDAFFNSITGVGSNLTLLNLSGKSPAAAEAGEFDLAGPVGIGKFLGDGAVFAGAYFYSCSAIQ